MMDIITGYNSNTTDGSVYIQWNKRSTNDGEAVPAAVANIGKFIAPMDLVYISLILVYIALVLHLTFGCILTAPDY